VLVLAVSLLMLWLISVAITDASIVDVFWGPGFAIVAWTCAWSRGFELDAGQWLLLALVSVWALRLGVYLGWRNLGHGSSRPPAAEREDRRYRAMRERVGPRFGLVSLVLVFGLQGAMLFVVSLPIQAALLAGGGPWFGVVALASLGLWLLGLAFESVGDWQLARFKADPRNAGKVMNRGLWAWTRHPNYFGDFAIWWGHFGLALALGVPWWTIVSPVVMSVLLMKVSGVPLLEASLKARRPGYAEYVRRTSAFFPRPRRG
jgi:steroid 5-alpha reductase family enzyme